MTEQAAVNKPLVCYLAHKIRDPRGPWFVEQHVRAAEGVALTLWAMNWACVCPGLNTRQFDGALPDGTWLTGDFEILKHADTVVMGPGWQDSEGAKAERECALANGVPVYYWDVDRIVLERVARDPSRKAQFAALDRRRDHQTPDFLARRADETAHPAGAYPGPAPEGASEDVKGPAARPRAYTPPPAPEAHLGAVCPPPVAAPAGKPAKGAADLTWADLAKLGQELFHLHLDDLECYCRPGRPSCGVCEFEKFSALVTLQAQVDGMKPAGKS